MSVSRQPIYFESGRESLFGWLHQAQQASRQNVGVVICKPFGYEAICAHGSLSAFADGCAAAGATVLRFDYSGTGDSSGGDTEADQMSQWCADIQAAMRTLRRSGQVSRIVLLGVRLGALLANLVAADDASVDAVISIAPVVSGRRYLRELRAYQVTSSSEGAAAAPASMPAAADGLEITGFSLSAASVERLTQTDLAKLGGSVVPGALILDRVDLPNAKTWADALLGAGTQVQYQALPGFLEMVSTPHAAQVPQEMLAAVVDYIGQYGKTHEVPARVPSAASEQWTESVHLDAADGTTLVERAVYVDEAQTLFAIVTQLQQPDAKTMQPSGYGVVMLNGGATSHIGPNRMYVDLARQWAARGYVVLRLDLAGLGDSATRPGRDDNEVYPPEAHADVSAAVDFLRRRYAVDNVTVAGLCAGAYHALRSAIDGLPVNHLLLINPLTFYWKQGSKLSDLQVSEVVRNPGVYAERVLTFKYWRKLLSGRVDIWRVAMVLLRRAWLAADSRIREFTRMMHIRLPQDLGWDLRSVASRGVRIVFVFARGDGGEELLRMQGGSMVQAIGERCRVYTIDGADHIFSQSTPRRQLIRLLTSELPM